MEISSKWGERRKWKHFICGQGNETLMTTMKNVCVLPRHRNSITVDFIQPQSNEAFMVFSSFSSYKSYTQSGRQIEWNDT